MFITAVPIVMGILSGMGGLFPPLGRFSTQTQNALFPNEIIDPLTAADLYNKGYIEYNKYIELQSKNGLSEDLSFPLVKGLQQRLSPQAYITAAFRGIINEDTLKTKLKQEKIIEDDQNILKEVSRFFPSPIDLVRFAIREVYTDSTAAKYGLFLDIPERFIVESSKAGLPEDQARNYWGAHWELPSASMGYEMFHRGVISREDLQELLKSLDIMPFWRDKLIQISYNPLTRVDVRRMYSLGVLGEEEVYKAYLYEGYSPENAKAMTEFTVKYESNEFDGITRSNITEAYKKDIITKDEMIEYFKGLKYTEKTIQFWIDSIEYEKTLEELTLYTDDIINQYYAGIMSFDDVRQSLLQLDVPSTYIESVTRKILTSKSKKSKLPTIDDLNRWLLRNIIDDSFYVQKMRLLGYSQEDIMIYLTELSEGIDTSKVKYQSIDVYKRWLAKGLINKDQFVTTLINMNIRPSDIEKYIIEIDEAKL